MIFYGYCAMAFYCGIVATLLVLYVVLSIALFVMKRRIKRMKEELEEG